MKLDRFMAWILLLCMLLYFVSGFGMTKGIIDGALAATIHNQLLPYIALTAFVIHTAYATRLAFIRWKIWSGGGQLIWGAFYLLLVGGFIYVGSYYQRPVATQNRTTQTGTVSTSASASANAISNTTSTSSVRTFSTSELAKYNGRNGQPAYAAINGTVYDFSSVFINGTHHGWTAGQDVTNEFLAQHNLSLLRSFTIVGTLTN